MNQTRQKQESALKAKLEERREEISKLREEAASLSAEAKEDFLPELEILEGKHSMLEHDWKVLADATESAWQEIKQGIDNSWHHFEEALQGLRDKTN